jgi:hypothetical protein
MNQHYLFSTDNSFSPIIEAPMMIKLNKDRIVRYPMMVKEYRTSWKAFVPKRPDDPADYTAYMDDKSEGEYADDGNGDISDDGMNQTMGLYGSRQ